MFCQNCGKEVADGAKFCPECGAVVGEPQKLGEPQEPREPQGAGLVVNPDYAGLRQQTEGVRRSEKRWSVIGTVYAVAVVVVLIFFAFRAMESIADGNASGWLIVQNIAVALLIACGIAYAAFEVRLPILKGQKISNARSYLEQISVGDHAQLAKALGQMNSRRVRQAYLDENGNACVQGKKSSYTFISREGHLDVANCPVSLGKILELETITGSLMKFLAPDAPVNAYRNEKQNARLSRRRLLMAVVAAVCGVVFVVLQLNSELLEGGSRYVRMVTTGCPQAYPDICYGDAFDAFFTDCEWEYFKSTEGQDVVEFHGKCLYLDEEAQIAMQFLLDCDEGTFELYALTIDGEPQTDLVKGIILACVFEDYGQGDGSGNLYLEDSTTDGEPELDFGEPEEEEPEPAPEEEPEPVPEEEPEDTGEEIDPLEVSGSYAGAWGSSFADINIYSSPESSAIGNATVYLDSEMGVYGGCEYSGELVPVDKNMYSLEDGSQTILLAVSYDADFGAICFELWIDGEYVEKYFMMEHYVS